MTRNPRSTPKARALAWWKARAETARYVVSGSESPSTAVARFLRSERLILEVARGRVWILTEPTRTDERGIFLLNYWAVVDEVMKGWTPAAILGIPAVHLHLDELAPPTVLPVLHAANRSRYAIELFDEFVLTLRPGTVAADHIVQLQAQDASVNALREAHVLATLDLPELELGIEPVSAWLRHLVLRTAELDDAVAARPRPVVLRRLSDLARQLGNTALAVQLDHAVHGITTRAPARSATGVGRRVVVPEPLISLPRGTGEPWLDRQRMTLERFRTVLDPLLDEHVGQPTGATLPRLIGDARHAKQYDAYHNTTMEGYHISQAVSDAVVRGYTLPDPIASQEQLRAIMAVQGYSIAFDLVIDRLRQGAPFTIDEALILDLYGALFRPSVDAGIVAPSELRGWRTINVGLTGGWRHVPPGHHKVPSLIRGLCEFLSREGLRPLSRAVLAHLEFVTVHPFIDGNGRLARLLMNYALLSAGYPWITIRADERHPYFLALETAQVDGDVEPLGTFLAQQLVQALRSPRTTPTPSRHPRGA